MVTKQFELLFFHQQYHPLVVQLLQPGCVFLRLLFINLPRPTLRVFHVEERSVEALFTVGTRSKKSEPIFKSVHVVVPPTSISKCYHFCRRFYQQPNFARLQSFQFLSGSVLQYHHRLVAKSTSVWS